MNSNPNTFRGLTLNLFNVDDLQIDEVYIDAEGGFYLDTDTDTALTSAETRLIARIQEAIEDFIDETDDVEDEEEDPFDFDILLVDRYEDLRDDDRSLSPFGC
jgi:hypothetical protein